MSAGYQYNEITAYPSALPLARATTKNVRPTFIVSIDAECDNAWNCKANITTANASFLPRFQQLCEQYGVRPTYFVNYEMATSSIFREFGRDLLKRRRGEIGMHLHAWNSPPIVPLTSNDTQYHPYLTEYPADIMRAKISYLTGFLEDAFSVPITSHRAGRWGLNALYARMLVERGYRTDCSVTPLTSWVGHTGNPSQSGGPDFTDFPQFPYLMDIDNIRLPGTSPLLEIPVTAMQLRPRLIQALSRPFANPSFVSRVMNRAFPVKCLLLLNPWNLNLVTRVIKSAVALGYPCVHLALHSSNLMPEGSPAFPRAKDVEKLYSVLTEVFSLAHEYCSCVTVTKFRNQFSEDSHAMAA